MPKISIITPVYCDIPQKVDWLDEMIQSVRVQTVTDWELILIDDKSPISTEPVRAKYANDSRLRWLENAQNEGPAKTRNTAVALAESNCILPVDSDDMLYEPETLENMYDAWLMDETKTIYGNLQMYKQTSRDAFEQVKLIQLGGYTFERAMNLSGTIPVTVMHSKECHYQAGGWKPELDMGLEDVEYWVSAGKRGFCGQKINYTTLIYRQQETSRAYKLKYINQEFRAMQDKIKSMHSDVYKGVYPMGCCGKGSATPAPNVDPVIMSMQARATTRITTLDGYEEKDLEWVLYDGEKTGRFDVALKGAANLPNKYVVYGKGHCFQVHKGNIWFFRNAQKHGYKMNQPDPRQQAQPEIEPEIEPEPQIQFSPQVTEAAPPEMSTIVRLDSVGAQTREAVIQEVIVEPTPAESYSDVMPNRWHLQDLGLTEKLTEKLSSAGWTVEAAAVTKPEILTTLPGIGKARSVAIIKKAKELINS